jgi:8-oxo-dGTP pyrophosphatase MutT (NUDIX family)
VPRPERVTAGAPPPWSTLDAPLRSSVPFARFVDALDARVPGDAPGGASAAVLVPVFPDPASDEATLVLIRRAEHLARDPGHVAFPGGRVEPGERPERTALREAEEEVGLDPTAVELHGVIEVVERPAVDEQIAAFLGVVGVRPALAPSAAEVESVLEVPVAALLAEGVAWQELWWFGEARRPMMFFADPLVLHDDLVWGMSARILWRVLAAFAQGA